MSKSQSNTFIKQVFNVGSKIFREGDKGDAVYLILSGEVQLFTRVHDRSKTIATLHSGEIFGEMALLSDNPRAATAMVTDTCEVLIVPRNTFEDQMKKVNPVIRSVVQTLTKRLLESA